MGKQADCALCKAQKKIYIYIYIQFNPKNGNTNIVFNYYMRSK